MARDRDGSGAAVGGAGTITKAERAATLLKIADDFSFAFDPAPTPDSAFTPYSYFALTTAAGGAGSASGYKGTTELVLEAREAEIAKIAVIIGMKGRVVTGFEKEATDKMVAALYIKAENAWTKLPKEEFTKAIPIVDRGVKDRLNNGLRSQEVDRNEAWKQATAKLKEYRAMEAARKEGVATVATIATVAAIAVSPTEAPITPPHAAITITREVATALLTPDTVAAAYGRS